MTDSRPLLTHLLDQIGAEMEQVLRDTAPIVAGYHVELVRQGVRAPEAITLALDMQRQLIADYILACREDDDGR